MIAGCEFSSSAPPSHEWLITQLHFYMPAKVRHRAITRLRDWNPDETLAQTFLFLLEHPRSETPGGCHLFYGGT